jgi:hypothetical protein
MSDTHNLSDVGRESLTISAPKIDVIALRFMGSHIGRDIQFRRMREMSKIFVLPHNRRIPEKRQGGKSARVHSRWQGLATLFV